MKRTTIKLFNACVVLAAAVLAGCQSESNSITLTTPAPNASFDTNNQTAMVNVMTRDLRGSAEVANYTKNGELRRLNSIPDTASLFQQAMQQNLNSKGFAIVQGAGNANVLVNVKKFFANVEQGNLRYKIVADVNVEVQVAGTRGNFSKNFNTQRSYEGALGAGNSEIQKVLSQAYTDAVQAIYLDNEITSAIHRVK